MTRPKLLHIITRFDVGGSADCTALTAARLQYAYNTRVIHGPTVQPCRYYGDMQSAGVGVIEERSLIRSISPFVDVQALWRLSAHISREKYDIVHTHTSKAGLLGRLAAFAAGTPIVIHTAHGNVFHDYFDNRTTAAIVAAERMLARKTDALIELTQAGIREHLALGIGKPKQFHVIHSGIVLEDLIAKVLPVERRGQRIALGADESSFLVGFIGRLEPIKDPLTALAGFAVLARVLPKARFLCVGSGTLKERLISDALAAGILERCTFVDFAPVERYLPLLDAFVLSSRNEGMGRILLEAMANGVAVLGSEVGGVPDLIKDGRNGLLFPVGDAVALGEKLSRLANDTNMRTQLVAAGRTTVEAYSAEAMVAKHDTLYRRLLREPPPNPPPRMGEG